MAWAGHRAALRAIEADLRAGRDVDRFDMENWTACIAGRLLDILLDHPARAFGAALGGPSAALEARGWGRHCRRFAGAPVLWLPAWPPELRAAYLGAEGDARERARIAADAVDRYIRDHTAVIGGRRR